ncbi:MAG: hypothetical protein HN855_10435 [Anaerolineae bacterium]|jgi:hypothetical protein|nr:hypothetical protein [Anaerolineae bacterium]MBT7325568.1 hypothetical protein [Anaerolineae bacterium]
MKKLFLLYSLFIISACGYAPEPQPTATPIPQENSVDLAATMLYNQIAANATEQAIQHAQLQREAAMSATAISVEATATFNAQATQAAHQAAIATATYQAYLIEATASKESWSAAATATERSVGWTATAGAENHALKIQSQITQQAAEAIRLEGESAQIALAVERQRIKNKADAILPWALVVISFVIAGAWMYGASKFKEATRNPDGTYNLPLLRSRNGWTVVRPELLPVGAAVIDAEDGSVIYQSHEDAAFQAETTRRAQAVDALRALPPGREKQAMQITAGAFNQETSIQDAEIELLPPENLPRIGPVLDELEGQVLEDRE